MASNQQKFQILAKNNSFTPLKSDRPQQPKPSIQSPTKTKVGNSFRPIENDRPKPPKQTASGKK